MANALYICYFGLRQPLVQTQVLPYLRELKKDGHEIILLTFEPDFSASWTNEQVTAEREKLSSEGIEWQCLPYHKRPSALATAYDIFRGALKIRGLIGKRKIDILHGRVHVPTLMGALARKFSRRKPKLLFDIRGFFPEEYTDAGIWPENGALYRAAKRIESWLMRESDGFVVLTEKAREILFPESRASGFDKAGRPVEVIPCCVDFERRFRENGHSQRAEARDRLELNDRFVVAHLGALGGLYLTEDIADLLAASRNRDPKTFALLLTQSDPALIVPLLQARGFGRGDYFVGKVDPKDIPAYLSASDVGLSFVKASFATHSRSPTKIPEYLACGVPIIANRGVGDVDSLIRENGIGALVEDLSDAGYLEVLGSIEELDDVSDQCRSVAREEFSLDAVAGERYRRLYQAILNQSRN